MDATAQGLFRAHADELPRALDFVEDFCTRHRVAADDRARLQLVVEELFSNTLRHGHRGDSDAPLRIALTADPAHLGLQYEDSAPPFDPLQYLRESAPDPATPVIDREPGGYGLPLVAQMAERFDYRFEGGFNRLQLQLRRT